MKNLRKVLKVCTVVLALVLMLSSGALAAQKVVISEMSWSGAIAVANIMKVVMEDKLGVPVELKQVTPDLTWAGMVKGSIDVYPDLWWPNQDAGIKKYVNEQKKAEITLSYDNAKQGWFVPTWVAEKYNIKTLDDLKDPEKAKIFDITGDGVGDIWAGGFGWFSTEVTKIQLRDFDLPLKNYVVDAWVFLTSLKEAMRVKKPILFYYWTPEWPFSIYDFTQIQMPEYDQAKWKYVPKKPEESKITCGWQMATVYAGFSAKLKEKSPKAYQFLKQWHIPIEEVNKLISDLEDVPGNPKQDPVTAARAWVEKNPALVEAWLKGIE